MYQDINMEFHTDKTFLKKSRLFDLYLYPDKQDDICAKIHNLWSIRNNTLLFLFLMHYPWYIRFSGSTFYHRHCA